MTEKLVWKEVVLLTLLFIAFFPKILSCIGEVTGHFAYSHIGIAQKSAKEGHISVHSVVPRDGTMQQHAYSISERTGITSLLVVINLITGLPLKTVLFLPINGFALILLSYVFARTLSKSRLIALMYTVFIAYEPLLNKLTYNISYTGIGWMSFMMLLILYLQWNRPKQKLSRSIPILVLITFLNSYFAYYVAEGMIILFLAIMLVLTITKAESKAFTYLSLVFMIIFAGFDPIFYSYLQSVSLQSIIDVVNHYVGYILGNIGFLTDSEILRTYPGSTLSFYIDMTVLIIISLPVLLYVPIRLIRHLKRTTVKESDDKLFFAIMLTGIGNGLLYLTRGHVSFSGVLLLFPLLTFIVIDNFKVNPKIKIAILLMILIFSPLKFTFHWNEEQRPYGDSFHSLTAPATYWIARSLTESNIITSLRIGGPLLSELMTAQKANDIYVFIFNDNSITPFYSNHSAVKEIFLKQGYTHLLLSLKYSVQVIDGPEWKLWKPLGENLFLISEHPPFDKIYDDGRSFVWFFTMYRSC